MRREYRRALEKLREGDWRAAHAIVQDLEGVIAYRLHALCHRVEGDLGNAGYWYRRAGMAAPKGLTTAGELAALAAAVAPRAKRGSRKS